MAVAATTAYIATNGVRTAAGINPALTAGYTRAFAVGAGFLVLAAIVAFFMFTIGKDAVKESDEDDDVPVVHVG